jgi:serine/threonine protein kinase
MSYNITYIYVRICYVVIIIGLHFVWITSTPCLNIHRLVRGDWGANVVHRDLKPANILVRRFPSPARLWFVVKVHRFVSFCRRPNLQKSLKFRLFSTSQLHFLLIGSRDCIWRNAPASNLMQPGEQKLWPENLRLRFSAWPWHWWGHWLLAGLLLLAISRVTRQGHGVKQNIFKASNISYLRHR